MARNVKGGGMRDPIALWDALLDDVAKQAAEDRVPTEDNVRWSREVDALVERQLAALRRRCTSVQ